MEATATTVVGATINIMVFYRSLVLLQYEHTSSYTASYDTTFVGSIVKTNDNEASKPHVHCTKHCSTPQHTAVPKAIEEIQECSIHTA